MNQKLFSVVIITFQHKDTLLYCINSVFNQTYSEIELIIVDDSSCDFNDQEVKRYIEENKPQNVKNTVVKTQIDNKGTTFNYQTGLQLARGEFLIFISGDDFLKDDCVLLDLCSQFEEKKANVIAARGQICSRDGEDEGYVVPYEYRIMDAKRAEPDMLLELIGREALQDTYICSGALVWKRSFLNQLGGFDLNYRYIQYWPLLVRICQSNIKITYSDRIVIKCRQGGIFDSSVGWNRFMKEIYYLESIKFLEEIYLPIMDKRKITAKLKCRFAIESLKGAITRDVYWWTMPIKERMLWRMKNYKLILLKNIWGLDITNIKLKIENILFFILLLSIYIRFKGSVSKLILGFWTITTLFIIILGLIVFTNFTCRTYRKLYRRMKYKNGK